MSRRHDIWRPVVPRVIGLDLSTFRREPPPMSTRYDAWRLDVRGGNQTRPLDFKKRTSTYARETWHLKTCCMWGWSDSIFWLSGESPHTCQRGMTLEDSLCAVTIALSLLDFEERALAHASEMHLLKTGCAQGNRTRSLRLWGESPYTCQRGTAPEDSLCAG